VQKHRTFYLAIHNVLAILFFKSTPITKQKSPLPYRETAPASVQGDNFQFQNPLIIRGPFVKFVNSPYYSDSELCGRAVTVSFSKYLPWQAMHFLQRSTHFSKTCCRPLITSKFLASELPFHGWKSPEIAWG
jgi:hypothetical protein